MLIKEHFNWASKFINFINEETVMLSVPLLLAYVYFFYNRLINPDISLKAIPTYFSKVGIGITVVLFLITKFVLAAYFTPSLPALRLIQNVTMQGIVNPLTSLVSHTVMLDPLSC